MDNSLKNVLKDLSLVASRLTVSSKKPLDILASHNSRALSGKGPRQKFESLMAHVQRLIQVMSITSVEVKQEGFVNHSAYASKKRTSSLSDDQLGIPQEEEVIPRQGIAVRIKDFEVQESAIEQVFNYSKFEEEKKWDAAEDQHLQAHEPFISDESNENIMQWRRKMVEEDFRGSSQRKYKPSRLGYRQMLDSSTKRSSGQRIDINNGCILFRSHKKTEKQVEAGLAGERLAFGDEYEPIIKEQQIEDPKILQRVVASLHFSPKIQAGISPPRQEPKKTASRKKNCKQQSLSPLSINTHTNLFPVRKSPAGRKVLDPLMEANLYSWILGRVDQGLAPSDSDIRKMSLRLSTQPDFKASQGWLANYTVRYQLRKLIPKETQRHRGR